MRYVFLLAIAGLIGCASAPTLTSEPATPTSEPAGEVVEPAKEKESKVTLAQFDQVKTGMTLAEVEAILGKGEKISAVEVEGLPETVDYQWLGKEFASNMVVTFQEGTAISKAQFGLK